MKTTELVATFSVGDGVSASVLIERPRFTKVYPRLQALIDYGMFPIDPKPKDVRLGYVTTHTPCTYEAGQRMIAVCGALPTAEDALRLAATRPDLFLDRWQPTVFLHSPLHVYDYGWDGENHVSIENIVSIGASGGGIAAGFAPVVVIWPTGTRFVYRM